MFAHLKGSIMQPTQEIAKSTGRSIKESSRRLQTEEFEVTETVRISTLRLIPRPTYT
jgi:hypothetical protein